MMITTFSWSVGLVWLCLLLGCISNRPTKTVVVNVYGGKTVYTSDGIESLKLRDLIGDKRKPDVLEVVFAAKMTHARILLVEEEVKSLSIPIVSFSESASGLRVDMQNGEEITRGELMDAIRKRDLKWPRKTEPESY